MVGRKAPEFPPQKKCGECGKPGGVKTCHICRKALCYSCATLTTAYAYCKEHKGKAARGTGDRMY